MTAGAIAEASQNRETTVAEEDSSKRKRLLDENDGAEDVVQTKRPRDDPGSEHLAGGSGEVAEVENAHTCMCPVDIATESRKDGGEERQLDNDQDDQCVGGAKSFAGDLPPVEVPSCAQQTVEAKIDDAGLLKTVTEDTADINTANMVPNATVVAVDGGLGGGGGPDQGTADEREASDAVPATKLYQQIHADLKRLIESAEPLASPLPSGDAWSGFADYIGEGARMRLHAVAALHLTRAGVQQCPEAVRQLPANSNRVLLGAATNCELYQERVIRALAKSVGARLLVVNSATLKLDDMSSLVQAGSGDEHGQCEGEYGPGGSGYDSSEEELDDLLQGLEDAKPPCGGRRRKQIATKSNGPKLRVEGSLIFDLTSKRHEGEGDPLAEGKDEPTEVSELVIPEEGEKKTNTEADTAGERTSNGQEAKKMEAQCEGARDKHESIHLEERTETVDKKTATEDSEAELTAPANAPKLSMAETVRQVLDTSQNDANARNLANALADAREQLAAHKLVALARGGASGDGATKKLDASRQQTSSFKKMDRVTYKPLQESDLPGGPSSSSRLDRIPFSSLSILAPGDKDGRISLSSLFARREAALEALKRRAAGFSNGEKSHGVPAVGASGRVLSVFPDGRVEVAMEEAFSGGKTRGGRKECIYVCNAEDLSPINDRDDAWASAFQALFGVINEELENPSAPPLVVLLLNTDRLLHSNHPDHFRKLKSFLATLPPRCLFVAAYCSRSLSRERATTGPPGLSMLFGGGGRGDSSLGMGSGGGGSDDFPPWFDRLGSAGRMSGRARASHKGKAMSSMLPNNIELHPPHDESVAKAWKKMIEADVAAMRTCTNRAALAKALELCGVESPDLDESLKICELQLTKKEVEQVVGAAVAAALTGHKELAKGVEGCGRNPLVLSAKLLSDAAVTIQKQRSEAAPQPERHALKDLQTDQYERQLLSEVIPPEEIPVGFDDIGALESVKNTLHEVLILPLQRPELFTRGSLTRPTKGLLLFGPPGTGKTMLAKAVASESGAHFINVNMSAITSKWLGEGERLVRAVFSLAHKLAPSVIFIDEIDSFLSRRGGQSQEHEALRKMKNEFMQHWDGLRTKAADRVLVLAATNRPMDLDDAVIRRMPRRIMVPLPDVVNREKILRVLLKDEDLNTALDVTELAQLTNGYSGSDLRNLCTAAAYCPIRELIEAERAAKSGNAEDKATTASDGHALRSISMADFKAAMKQVTPSTHAESASISDLQRWNEQFGEGGSRRAEPLVYFT